MNDIEIEEAYKSLDTNGDGVIDYSEFRLWFLNGQKTFSAAKRTFKQFTGSLGYLENKDFGEVNSCLKKSKKLKKQKIKIGFNEPENPNDRVQARINFWGKDHDFWMQEADKFWKKYFPEVEREAPLNYVRIAVPHSDKKVVSNFLDFIKNQKGWQETVKEMKANFMMIDWEVFDDKVVLKTCVCPMSENYEGSPLGQLSGLQTAFPPEILETLKKSTQYASFDMSFNNLFNWY